MLISIFEINLIPVMGESTLIEFTGKSLMLPPCMRSYFFLQNTENHDKLDRQPTKSKQFKQFQPGFTVSED